MLKEWFYFLTSLKPKVNYAQGMVLFFDELETKRINYALDMVSFLCKLETKSVNYA